MTDYIDTLQLFAKTWTSEENLFEERARLLGQMSPSSKNSVEANFLISLTIFDEEAGLTDDRYRKRMYTFISRGWLPEDRYSFTLSKMPMTVRNEEGGLKYDWEYLTDGRILLTNEKEILEFKIELVNQDNLNLRLVKFTKNE